MKDQDILCLFYQKTFRVTKHKLNLLTEEQLTYLENRYPKDEQLENRLDNLKNIIYRMYYKLETCSYCQTCGKKLFRYQQILGGIKYCSEKCRSNNPEFRKNWEQAIYNKFGVYNPFASKEIRENIKNKLLEERGVVNVSQLPEVKEKISAVYEERIKDNPNYFSDRGKKSYETAKKRHPEDPHNRKQCEATMLKKTGYKSNVEIPEVKKKSHSEEANKKRIVTSQKHFNTNHPMQSKEISNKVLLTKAIKKLEDPSYEQNRIDKWHASNFKKCGYENNLNMPEVIQKAHSPEAQQKAYETRKKNNTFNSSKPEEKVYVLLKEKFKEVLRNYKEERYPFHCDFYIPELDLFIECNFHWTHGSHPFNINNEEDINILNEMKTLSEIKPYYKAFINTWTIRDVNKINTSIKNNLNYLIFYAYKELETWLNKLHL